MLMTRFVSHVVTRSDYTEGGSSGHTTLAVTKHDWFIRALLHSSSPPFFLLVILLWRNGGVYFPTRCVQQQTCRYPALYLRNTDMDIAVHCRVKTTGALVFFYYFILFDLCVFLFLFSPYMTILPLMSYVSLPSQNSVTLTAFQLVVNVTKILLVTCLLCGPSNKL